MKPLYFTHELLVPKDASTVSNADGYFEEITGAQVYALSQSEYDLLRKVGGLFEIFDHQFGTIIDDCEEDQICADDVTAAIQEAERLYEQSSDPAEKKAVKRVLEALLCANSRGVYCEISNGIRAKP